MLPRAVQPEVLPEIFPDQLFKRSREPLRDGPRGIRVDAGLVDPAEAHAKRPLAEHAEDFRRYLAAKGNTPEYVAKLLFRLTAVLDGCRCSKIGDLQSSVVVEFLGALRSHGKSVKTANDYLAAAKGFTRCLPGLDRHFLYMTGCATGFQVSELASMTPESFDLDGNTPTAKAQASCTKNRKEAASQWLARPEFRLASIRTWPDIRLMP
jgi:hypothetical protein